jgi:hypothetical protein
MLAEGVRWIRVCRMMSRPSNFIGHLLRASSPVAPK